MVKINAPQQVRDVDSRAIRQDLSNFVAGTKERKIGVDRHIKELLKYYERISFCQTYYL